MASNDFQQLKRSYENAPDEVLYGALSENPGSPYRQAVQSVLEDRRLAREAMRHQELSQRLDALRKPHWTATPAFWVACFAAACAFIAAWPVIKGWFF